MIYEMRTYTVKTGELATVVENAGSLARDIRGNDYGILEGYWITEIGPLSQVMHLWRYNSYEERTQLRENLLENTRWTEEYLPTVLPRLVRQDIRLMKSFLPFKTPENKKNVYEFRHYTAHPGKAQIWADLFANVMPAREKYSPNVCAWITEAGQPNEVCHLWAYSDLNERAAARAEAAKDPDWREFLGAIRPLIASAQNAILLPSPHSPLQ